MFLLIKSIKKPLPQEKFLQVEFEDETTGTNIPDQFVPAIKKVSFLSDPFYVEGYVSFEISAALRLMERLGTFLGATVAQWCQIAKLEFTTRLKG